MHMYIMSRSTHLSTINSTPSPAAADWITTFSGNSPVAIHNWICPIHLPTLTYTIWIFHFLLRSLHQCERNSLAHTLEVLGTACTLLLLLRTLLHTGLRVGGLLGGSG